jgi:hypothetical protein
VFILQFYAMIFCDRVCLNNWSFMFVSAFDEWIHVNVNCYQFWPCLYLCRCLMISSFCYASLYQKILSINKPDIKQSSSLVKFRCKTNTFLKASTRYFWFHYNTSLWLKDNFYVHSHGPNLHCIVNRNPSNLALMKYTSFIPIFIKSTSHARSKLLPCL